MFYFQIVQTMIDIQSSFQKNWGAATMSMKDIYGNKINFTLIWLKEASLKKKNKTVF